jgi:hypothetical protein
MRRKFVELQRFVPWIVCGGDQFLGVRTEPGLRKSGRSAVDPRVVCRSPALPRTELPRNWRAFQSGASGPGRHNVYVVLSIEPEVLR